MWKIEFPRGKLTFPRSQSGLVLKARLTVNTFVNHHGDNLTGRTHTPFPAIITAKKEVWASELSRWVFTPFLPFSSLRLTTLSTHKQAILTISLRPLRREELQTTSSKKMIQTSEIDHQVLTTMTATQAHMVEEPPHVYTYMYTHACTYTSVYAHMHTHTIHFNREKLTHFFLLCWNLNPGLHTCLAYFTELHCQLWHTFPPLWFCLPAV